MPIIRPQDIQANRITKAQLSFIESLLIDLEWFEKRSQCIEYCLGKKGLKPGDLTKSDASKFIGWLLEMKEKLLEK